METKWGDVLLVYALQLMLAESKLLYSQAKVFYLVSETCVPLLDPLVFLRQFFTFSTRIDHHAVDPNDVVRILSEANAVPDAKALARSLIFHQRWLSLTSADADTVFCTLEQHLSPCLAPEEWFVGTALNEHYHKTQKHKKF